ncbi:MAG: secondary thiamine-phosphate synthase enzyme [Candidatus Kerfeldbacteria bacterium CG_4_10_14_0_8_um_filter_42_10]|uniref:Secondary thiamine-phosphate synthase enzyme n=1 Tax=Candidatus Kerfeldbacteria bacterium CG_4_10_14_0_8_um_filter_42_10 TaxID=2014248 RepID=A0A2M7RFV1_9BACT|nr:MAG: secondary thiamine-phosphate synthase enzyme [Candidatus Kerfeldbacteria bacterium CG_4_10_14_0_8_um_filter_42_10]
MKIVHTTLVVETGAAVDIRNITEPVQKVVAQSGIQNGVVTVYVRHTTAAIRINEQEDGFLKDLKRLLTQLVPEKGEYQHDDFATRDPGTMHGSEERCNGHAHLQQIIAGNTSETIPLRDGQLLLGEWQKILLIELSDPRKREVVITVMGE